MNVMAKVESDVLISTEQFTEAFQHEVMPLLERHWEEIALNKDVVELDPDFDFYRRAVEAGHIVIYTVRHGPEQVLIGYAAYLIGAHKHYRRTKWAVSDVIIVMPEHRNAGTGSKLMKFIERDLRQRGVTIMHTTSKVEHPELAWLLESHGHDLIEKGHSKRLI